MELESCSATLLISRQLLSEEIWSVVQFYALLCDWNLLVDVCPLSSPSFDIFLVNVEEPKKGTTMWGLVLEEIILVIVFNHTGESFMVSSRRCSRLFLQLGLRFPSVRGDFLVEIYILLSLVLFGTCRRISKVRNKWNIKPYETICWSMPHPVPLVWLVLDSNHCCYIIMGHSTVSEKYRLNLWGNSDTFFTSTTSSWVFAIPCTLGPDLF